MIYSLFSCIWHLPTMPQFTLVAPNLKKDMSWSQWLEQLSACLWFIVKILEKLVSSKDSSYLDSQNLCNTCQSAYRSGHSTDTALLKIINDLFLSLSIGNISVLVMRVFSWAFATIDHFIHVHRLHADFGFTVLQWFSSYLIGHTDYVYLYYHCSAIALVHSGVLQSSTIGPILFYSSINTLSAIIDLSSIIHHSFCD